MALAAFALVPCNLLLLDEASNHLDAATINALTTALQVTLLLLYTHKLLLVSKGSELFSNALTIALQVKVFLARSSVVALHQLASSGAFVSHIQAQWHCINARHSPSGITVSFIQAHWPCIDFVICCCCLMQSASIWLLQPL